MQTQPSNSQSPSSPTHKSQTAEPRSPRDPDPREVLDDHKRRAILLTISAGSSRRAAARRVGCSPSTITRTAERDPEFAEQLAMALQKIESECLAHLRSAAAQGQWRAAAWLLERTNPDDFAKRPPHSFGAEDLCSIVHRVVATLADELSPEAYERLCRTVDQALEDELGDRAPAPQPTETSNDNESHPASQPNSPTSAPHVPTRDVSKGQHAAAQPAASSTSPDRQPPSASSSLLTSPLDPFTRVLSILPPAHSPDADPASRPSRPR